MIFDKNQKYFVEKDSIEATLKTIIKLLSEYSYPCQADYMEKVLKTVVNNNKPEFESISNTKDIWGGSGAVWEVYIKDRDKEVEFQRAMIKFIGLLNDNGIRNYGIRSIKVLFEKEVKKKLI